VDGDNKETVEFLIEFIACFKNSSEVISNFLRFYLSTSYDKFDILNIIHETLNLDLVEEIFKASNDLLSYLSKRHPKNCLKYINFLLDNFANNSDLLKDVPKTRNEIEMFLSTSIRFRPEFANLWSEDDDFLNCIKNFKNVLDRLDPEFFENMILRMVNNNLLIFYNFNDSLAIKWFECFGFKLTEKLILRKYVKDFQNSNYIFDIIERYYQVILNYLSHQESLENNDYLNLYEQLKNEAFRQLSVKYNFTNFINSNIKNAIVSQDLLDHGIFRKTSDGCEFNDSSHVEIFGFLKFWEFLNSDQFDYAFSFNDSIQFRDVLDFMCLATIAFPSKRNYLKIQKITELNIIIHENLNVVKESFLKQNSIGKSIFHVFSESNLKNSLLLDFSNFIDDSDIRLDLD
jgi:hypothetical protein